MKKRTLIVFGLIGCFVITSFFVAGCEQPPSDESIIGCNVGGKCVAGEDCAGEYDAQGNCIGTATPINGQYIYDSDTKTCLCSTTI